MGHGSKPARILIVHPQAAECERLRRVVTREDAAPTRIHEAGTADEALVICHAFALDCVVIKHAPPELDALDFLARLRGQSGESAPPLIVVASLSCETIGVRVLKMGAQDFLVEPRVEEDLGFAVESAIQNGKLLSQIREHRRDLELGVRALEESEERYRVLVEGVTDYAIVMLDPEGRIISWNVGAENLFGERAEDVAGEHYGRYFTDESRGRGDPDRLLALAAEHARASEEGWMIRRGGERFLANLAITSLRDHDGVLRGYASVTRDVTERVRTQGEILDLNSRLERRLRRINALRRIDVAIASGRDLGTILSVVVAQARGELGVDAALVLLSDSSGDELVHAAGAGLPDTFSQTLEGGSAGLARRVVQSGSALHVLDLARVLTPDSRLPRLLELGFKAYHAVPLTVEKRILGVMECFRRDASPPDAEWLDFLRILARQASIAIEHVNLLAGLQASHAQLGLAYDATIESLSRAMDLRDHETEGHSRRVTELTVKLARKIGLSDLELVQVRRGSLLHDIGKLGVPDQILLKPGALTDDEWVAMKRHPTYAVEILGPIDFLRPALEIPHYHHERFDGQGYPAGLAGDEIPLAARIFAVVDVWDALSNDRPYRKAWDRERILEHLGTLAGNHLDPCVVAEFLELVRAPSEPIVNGFQAAEPALDPSPRPAPVGEAAASPGRPARNAAEARILFTLPESDRSQGLSRMLGELGIHPSIAADSEAAWQDAQAHPFEILLVDDPSRSSASQSLIARVRGLPGRPYTYIMAFRERQSEVDRALTQCLLADDIVPLPVESGELAFRFELARRSLELRRELLARSVDAERLQDELRLRDQKLADLAVKDHLTGLANRRRIVETLNAYMAMSSRRGEPISILMLDLDCFRVFNEEHGQAAGDQALRTIAELLGRAVRRGDLVARHGGDEFVVILTHCDQKTARLVADRFRADISRADWGPRPITASMGLATCAGRPWDGEDLLARASHALAMAKRRGRDRALHHDDLNRYQPRFLTLAAAPSDH